MATPGSPASNFNQKGKGKAQAPAEDFYDLNPTITYRHILSQTLGPRDPLRVIALCDSDAFYAACEMVRLGVDNDTPLVVLQWDALIAVNYAARKFGISRMDKKKDALKRCPHLWVVHVATYKEGEKEPGYWDDVDTNTHKVSLDHYRRESMKIAAMFKESLPGCEVEKASIDEAFIDFTKPVREILLQRYPYLAQPPPDAPNGVDTPLPDPPPMTWDGLGSLIPINPPPPPEDKNESEESENQGASNELQKSHADLAVEHHKLTWHDVALSIAAELMGQAREEVRVSLGYSTSAGIARNKFLAKLTASYRKPNGQSILRNAAIPNYLKPLPFQKIRFLGGKLGKAFAEEYDASAVGDLLSIGLDEMQHKFGENSVWVWEVLRGIDRNEVKDKGSTLNKSMLASKNLPKAITEPSEGQHWIRVLAAELALRLNDARKMAPNLWPKSLVLHARKGYESGRSKQAPFPFVRDVTVDVIASAGNKLWKELVGNNKTLNVTTVSLAFTGIEASEAGQRSIDGFLKPHSAHKRLREPSEIVDQQVQDRMGSDHERHNDEEPSYTCSRCGKTFLLQSSAKDQLSEDQVKEALTKIKLEHDDFHFAKDLARETSPQRITAASSSSGPTTPKANKRRKPATKTKVNGIEKFFQR